jgi:hypothetical protein
MQRSAGSRVAELARKRRYQRIPPAQRRRIIQALAPPPARQLELDLRPAAVCVTNGRGPSPDEGAA